MITEDLPDGCWLGLSEADYFAQSRLGSSDLIKLHKQREGWWWASAHNPDREDVPSEAQNYGSALHAVMLEGRAAYETRFAVEPDPNDWPGRLVTIAQIKAALVEDGFDLKGTSSFALADWVDAAATHIPARPVWEAIKADFERKRGDRRPIGAAEDRMLRFMLEAALDHDETRALLGYGEDVPTLAEVSVFWTDAETGIKRRARLDKPVPKFTLDLKSVGNWQGDRLDASLDRRIKQNGYDIQRADYHTARRQMHKMIAASADQFLHGGTVEERAWAEAIAIRDLPFDWVWLFYQKPEPSGRAPVIFPVWDDTKSRYHLSGHRKAWRALRTYQECVERFGLGDIPPADGSTPKPWSSVEPVHYTRDDMEPHIRVDPFSFDDDPVPGEEEAIA